MLAPAALIPIAQIAVMLFFPDQLGSLHSFLSFNGWGVGVLVVGADTHLSDATMIPLGSLSLEQRGEVAALLGLCAACNALV